MLIDVTDFERPGLVCGPRVVTTRTLLIVHLDDRGGSSREPGRLIVSAEEATPPWRITLSNPVIQGGKDLLADECRPCSSTLKDSSSILSISGSLEC